GRGEDARQRELATCQCTHHVPLAGGTAEAAAIRRNRGWWPPPPRRFERRRYPAPAPPSRCAPQALRIARRLRGMLRVPRPAMRAGRILACAPSRATREATLAGRGQVAGRARSGGELWPRAEALFGASSRRAQRALPRPRRPSPP